MCAGKTRAKKEIVEFTVNQAVLGVPYTINLLPLDYAVVQLLSWEVSNAPTWRQKSLPIG